MSAAILGEVRPFALALAVVLAACGSARAPLAGTDLGAGMAPDFTLQDAVTGASLSLSSLRGRVIALAFLYTSCPDTCPLTAELLRAARERLGADAARVELVAVSVDPERDTPPAVRAFSEAHRLGANWHYLTGTRSRLAPVWALYGIRAAPAEGPSTAAHSDAIFLIDPQGRERTLLHADESVDALAGVFRALLSGG